MGLMQSWVACYCGCDDWNKVRGAILLIIQSLYTDRTGSASAAACRKFRVAGSLVCLEFAYLAGSELLELLRFGMSVTKSSRR